MKTPAPKHDYVVTYRRVPTGIIFNHTWRDTTVQEIVKSVGDMEADDHEAEIIFIVKL